MISEKFIEAKSYITPSKLPEADYAINPYTGCPHKCMYCYAEFMKRFTNHIEEWGDFIDVKLCSKKLDPQKYAGKRIVIGSVTDPYNPFERQYAITRKILKELQGCEGQITVITKSDLVLRDIDLIKELPDITVAVSINTLDDTIRQGLEPFAPAIQRRLDALGRLHTEGIKNVLFMSPIFPRITNAKEIILKTKDYIWEYWFENLNLRAAYKPRILNYIRNSFPEHTRIYHEIYNFNDKSYWKKLWKEIDSFCIEQSVPRYKNYFHHDSKKKQ